MKMQSIAPSKPVRKLGHREGKTVQIGNARLTWKATGEDTGYTTSLYEMDLLPENGIPLHSHPYSEVFYVLQGRTDFVTVNDQGEEEWVRCAAGETVIVPINRLHAFHNRTEKPSRFLSFSVYYHQVLFDRLAQEVDVDSPQTVTTGADPQEYIHLMQEALKQDMYFPQASLSNGREVLQELKDRTTVIGI
ncbi:cupin domain-containing protein [Edaphobacter modestus]|uniref:Cupin domain n=1 Tax=Edaphobacter modestus TaxID=388466 RepID=A0A4Q7YUT9_9BACT|nr:cupin domain-containing protein [Edaphobacter modestus]RZU41642.1 cupin domain [Edaphobacter modestus]